MQEEAVPFNWVHVEFGGGIVNRPIYELGMEITIEREDPEQIPSGGNWNTQLGSMSKTKPSDTADTVNYLTSASYMYHDGHNFLSPVIHWDISN